MTQNKVEKALRTIMIGAIDRVEQHFGDLWGFNGQGTENKEIKERFLQFRESMLDYGEAQICKLKGTKWEKKK